jgi:hypothetical protein
VNPDWFEEQEEVRVGVKAVFEFFPPPLVERLKETRKKEFQRDHHICEAQASRAAASVRLIFFSGE